MTLQLNTIALLLVILLILGVLSNNSTITISAAVLLIMQQTFLSSHIPLLEKYGVKIGIIILSIGVLSPLVSGKFSCLIYQVFLVGKWHFPFPLVCLWHGLQVRVCL